MVPELDSEDNKQGEKRKGKRREGERREGKRREEGRRRQGVQLKTERKRVITEFSRTVQTRQMCRTAQHNERTNITWLLYLRLVLMSV